MEMLIEGAPKWGKKYSNKGPIMVFIFIDSKIYIGKSVTQFGLCKKKKRTSKAQNVLTGCPIVQMHNHLAMSSGI